MNKLKVKKRVKGKLYKFANKKINNIEGALFEHPQDPDLIMVPTNTQKNNINTVRNELDIEE